MPILHWLNNVFISLLLNHFPLRNSTKLLSHYQADIHWTIAHNLSYSTLFPSCNTILIQQYRKPQSQYCSMICWTNLHTCDWDNYCNIYIMWKMSQSAVKEFIAKTAITWHWTHPFQTFITMSSFYFHYSHSFTLINVHVHWCSFICLLSILIDLCCLL